MGHRQNISLFTVLCYATSMPEEQQGSSDGSGRQPELKSPYEEGLPFDEFAIRTVRWGGARDAEIAAARARGAMPREISEIIARYVPPKNEEDGLREGGVTPVATKHFPPVVPSQRESVQEHALRTMEELREKYLNDPDYAPPLETALQLLSLNPNGRPHHRSDTGRFFSPETEGAPIFELYTEEYIKKLGEYIQQRAVAYGKGNGQLKVLEVGAGNGKLAHLLRKEIARKGLEGDISVIAVDSGKWEETHAIAPISGINVERMDYNAALQEYMPGMVLCAWMPGGEDWSKAFRDTESVREYVLIGEPDGGASGSGETWGVSWESMPAQTIGGFRRRDLPFLRKWQISRTDFENGPTRVVPYDGSFRVDVSDWSSRFSTVAFLRDNEIITHGPEETSYRGGATSGTGIRIGFDHYVAQGAINESDIEAGRSARVAEIRELVGRLQQRDDQGRRIRTSWSGPVISTFARVDAVQPGQWELFDTLVTEFSPVNGTGWLEDTRLLLDALEGIRDAAISEADTPLYTARARGLATKALVSIDRSRLDEIARNTWRVYNVDSVEYMQGEVERELGELDAKFGFSGEQSLRAIDLDAEEL